LVGQQAYTQSMRYAKVFSTGSSFKLPYWILLPNPVKHTIEGIVRGVSPRRDLNTGKLISPTLWLPWWIWVLAGVAIIAAGGTAAGRRSCSCSSQVLRRLLRAVARARGVEHASCRSGCSCGLPRRDGRGRDRAAHREGG
jgi:hypothetical protein